MRAPCKEEALFYGAPQKFHQRNHRRERAPGSEVAIGACPSPQDWERGECTRKALRFLGAPVEPGKVRAAATHGRVSVAQFPEGGRGGAVGQVRALLRCGPEVDSPEGREEGLRDLDQACRKGTTRVIDSRDASTLVM